MLRDTDGDWQADLYSPIEHRFRFTRQYHEFAYGPFINSAEELFFSTGLSSSGRHKAKKSGSGQMSSALGCRGWVMKVDNNGDLKLFASGLRSPAGVGMNENDEFFVTDIRAAGWRRRISGMSKKETFSGIRRGSGTESNSESHRGNLTTQPLVHESRRSRN